MIAMWQKLFFFVCGEIVCVKTGGWEPRMSFYRRWWVTSALVQ
jgi:hypothetical protein